MNKDFDRNPTIFLHKICLDTLFMKDYATLFDDSPFILSFYSFSDFIDFVKLLDIE